jgi:GAF domain-containing protein
MDFERIQALDEAPLYEGERISLFRGRFGLNALPCIVKATKPGLATGDLAKSLEAQYRCAESLGQDICPRPLYFGPDADRLIYAYEDCGGETLAERMREGPMEARTALSIGLAIADTLWAMQRKAYIHRALSPCHVVLRPDGRALFIGLGNARALAARGVDDYALPLKLERLGYLSPEHTGRTTKTMDWRSDVFSLAAVLYALLTGSPPFKGRNRVEIIHDCIAGLPPAPSSLRPGISAFIDGVVAKAMAKNPDERYRTMAGFIADLRRAADAPEAEQAQGPGAYDEPEALFASQAQDGPGTTGLMERLQRCFPGDDAAREILMARFLSLPPDPSKGLEDMLLTLSAEGKARFDAAQGRWSLSEAFSRDRDYSAELYERLPVLLARLDDEELRFLECASVEGLSFDASAIAAILRSEENPESLLDNALKLGLITREGGMNLRYHFSHPIIRERIYGSLEQIRRSAWHSAFASRYEEVGRPDMAARHILADPLRPRRRAEVIKRVAIFLEAAKTYAITDPSQAFELAAKGIDLLGGGAWRDAYDLSYDLRRSYCYFASAAGLETEFRLQARELAAHALPEDATEASIAIIKGLVTLGKSSEAVDEGIRALRALGFRVPANPGPPRFFASWLYVRAVLYLRSDKSITEAPAMADARARKALRLIMSFGTSVYVVRPLLISSLVSLGIRLCMRHGSHPELASLLATQGMLECGLSSNYMLGRRYGDLADLLAERNALAGRYSQAKLLTASFVTHWTKPFKDTLDSLLDAARLGKAMGDAEFSSHAYATYLQYLLFSGKSLTAIAKELPEISGAVHSQRQDLSIVSVDASLAFIDAVRDGRCAGDGPVGGWPNWKACQDDINKQGLDAIVCDLALYRAMLAYAGKRISEAREAIEAIRPYWRSYAGQYPSAVLVLVDALVSSREASAAAARGERDARALRRLAYAARYFAKLRRVNPALYEGKAALTKAFVYFFRGRLLKSSDHFESALRQAHAAGQLLDEAVIASSYALCLEDSGRGALAAFQLRIAYNAINRWGAPLLAANLAERHPDLARWVKESSDGGAGGGLRYVDAETIIRASAALASAGSGAELHERIAGLCMEAAGARQALLWLPAEGGWTLVYDMLYGQDTLREPATSTKPDASGSEDGLRPGPFLAQEGWPAVHSALQAAAERQRLIIEDKGPGRGSSAFLPLVNSGRTIGIVELRNDLMSGAFSEDGMGVAETLAVQAARALENAELYQQLERKVSERTAELEEALRKVRALRGLIPICASCKKVRDDQGYWSQVEEYISARSEADFTHGLCPDCLKRYYDEYNEAQESDDGSTDEGPNDGTDDH